MRHISRAAPTTTHPHARTDLELVPLSIQRALDPALRAEPAIRRKLPGEAPADSLVDDIRWSDRLFELPAFKGIQVSQIAAGARSSFVRTEDGRALGWGANEFGYVSG